MEKQDDTFEINLFDLDETSGFNNIIKELEDDDSSDTDTDVVDTEDSAVVDDEDDTQDELEIEDQEEEEEESVEEEEESTDDEPSDIDKTILSFVEKGILLLPEGYEYEDTPEAIEKAFQDSENYRNQLAFIEAINFLTSDKGIDVMKLRKSKEAIQKFSEIDVETANDDLKQQVIEDFYRRSNFSDDEIAEKIEDLFELDKVDKEFKRVLDKLVKLEEKEIANEAAAAEERNRLAREEFEKSKNLLKTTLEKTENFNGYAIDKARHNEIQSMIYEPIKDENGKLTTEFNKRLEIALNRADTFLVIADLLAGMNDKGFDFSSLMDKATTQATKRVKKTLRLNSNTNSKAKVSGKRSQSSSDFDLSKATLGFK